jgi:hypothetical protein
MEKELNVEPTLEVIIKLCTILLCLGSVTVTKPVFFFVDLKKIF